MTADATLPLSSGYFQRNLHKFPKQGSKLPWKLYQNYAKDVLLFRYGKIDDGTMVFTKAGDRVVAPSPVANAPAEPLSQAS